MVLALVSGTSDHDPVFSVRLAPGQAMLIDPVGRHGSGSLEIREGIARVFCPCEGPQGMTLAFLQSGDLLLTDRLCSNSVCVDALTPLAFRSHSGLSDDGEFDLVNEWVLQLLRVRHLGSAEQRLQTLFSLMVTRLGRRCGGWYDLPFRLAYERIGELIGATRVTTTRLISRSRSYQLLVSTSAEPYMRLAPALVLHTPLPV